MNSFIQESGNHQIRNGCSVVVVCVCLFYCYIGSFESMYPPVNKNDPPHKRSDKLDGWTIKCTDGCARDMHDIIKRARKIVWLN